MSKKIPCIIVDDEPMAREILESHLRKIETVEIVALCKNAIEAFNVISSHSVDLIFLDINMPEISGLSFAKSINNSVKVIFTTAYREYAVDGFDLQAMDYLLKPISFGRLMQSINKYLSENQQVDFDEPVRIEPEKSESVFVRSDRKMIKINFPEILYIESLSDFAILCRTKAQMRVLEKALNDHSIPFQQINEDEFLHHKITRILINLLKYSCEPENLFLRNKITSQLNINPILLDKIHNQHRDLQLQEYLNFLWTEFIVNKTEEDYKIFDKFKHLAAKYTNDTENFIKHITLGQPADLYQPEIEKVSLMTIHAAKGLEFKCVFIAGCENGLIPYSLFKEQKTDNDEEKRLLYVGMTRAKAMLYLTHAKKRFIKGRELELPKSPFLNLIEKQLAEQTKNDYKKPDKNHGQLSLFS